MLLTGMQTGRWSLLWERVEMCLTKINRLSQRYIPHYPMACNISWSS